MKILALFLLFAAVNSQSCLGRCGHQGNSSSCDCTPSCSIKDNCCHDHRDVCFSCRGRCGEEYLRGRLCHCDYNCKSNMNCCHDIDAMCSDIRRGATTSDLRVLTEQLLSADPESRAININLQGQGQEGDLAPRPLFNNVPTRALVSNTMRLMEDLQGNYWPNVSLPEVDDPAEVAEREAFLDALMRTKVVQLTENFLKERGFLTGSLRDKMKELWFTTYERRKVLSSSGFEHVFAGEVKGQKVLGLHNWVFFLHEEQEGDINYQRWIKSIDLGNKGEVIKIVYEWNGKVKKAGSMFVGTSPELEISLYTLCIMIRPNRGCPVQLNGHRFNLQTWVLKSNGKNVVGGAYPAI